MPIFHPKIVNQFASNKMSKQSFHFNTYTQQFNLLLLTIRSLICVIKQTETGYFIKKNGKNYLKSLGRKNVIDLFISLSRKSVNILKP